MSTYYDSLTSGLVPVRLIRRYIEKPTENCTFEKCELEVTHTRGCYPKGYRIDCLAHRYVRKLPQQGAFIRCATITD